VICPVSLLVKARRKSYESLAAMSLKNARGDDTMQAPNKDMAQKFGDTLSHPAGKGTCWNFFIVIDDRRKLTKVSPDLNLKTNSIAQYAICKKIIDTVVCSIPKYEHVISSKNTFPSTQWRKSPLETSLGLLNTILRWIRGQHKNSWRRKTLRF
jgi:hypothetical protein